MSKKSTAKLYFKAVDARGSISVGDGEDIEYDTIPYIKGVCGGEEFEMEIDLETGKIIGWSEKQFLSALTKDEDEDKSERSWFILRCNSAVAFIEILEEAIANGLYVVWGDDSGEMVFRCLITKKEEIDTFKHRQWYECKVSTIMKENKSEEFDEVRDKIKDIQKQMK